MATYFVDAPLPGNDANDGLDNIGVGLATATWTAATTTLTQAGHGYTFTAGDLIFISGGTGATAGLYEVESSTANDIVLADPHTNTAVDDLKDGSDLAAGDLATGDITSSDGPWLTVDKSMNTVAAGDYVWVRGGTDYTETATVDTVGTGTNPILYAGYTTSCGDGGKFTIDGEDTRANCIGVTISNVNSWYRFDNMILKQATGSGFSATTINTTLFVNCEANDNGGSGFDNQRNCVFLDCSADNNINSGFKSSIEQVCLRCTSTNNDDYGYIFAGGVCWDCIGFANAKQDFRMFGNSTVAAVCINCVGDGNDVVGSAGFFNGHTGGWPGVVLNSISIRHQFGMSGVAGRAERLNKDLWDYNLVNGNTSQYVTNAPQGDNDVTDAPAFTDEDNQDYTLTPASPAINAGTDFAGDSPGMDMGAHQSVDAGGYVDTGLVKS